MAEPPAPGSPESGNSGDDSGPSGGGGGGGRAQEHERFFPNAKIGRIMRKATPENGKISKEATVFMQECAFEFISFITSEAIDRCQKDRRKSINGDDLLWAFGALGFEDYVKPLKLYLQLYREMEGDSKGSRSVDQSGSGKKDGPADGDSVDSINGE